uniref:Uncharacterized protein n=1 Tax=Timema shepardi TaxID=629360 RepID=A0A7R9AKG4_TIMSH|nr:unnamed protein product [Timema shepardi]
MLQYQIALATETFPKRDVTNIFLFNAVIGSGLYILNRKHLTNTSTSTRISSHKIFNFSLTVVLEASCLHLDRCCSGRLLGVGCPKVSHSVPHLALVLGYFCSRLEETILTWWTPDVQGLRELDVDHVLV